MKKHLEICFEDNRGSIRDIFVSSPKDHCCIITFTPDAVRANHFHKKSTQYTYVIDGEILMGSCIVDQDGNLVGDIERVVLKPGDLVTHQPYHAHAFRANSAASILAFADGVRGGVDYESDVFRLKTSLV
ncbi:Cupin 1 [Candidatus Methylopumilus universalis]|uniref:cupin domain-containing protein n=1 Tax=Candidatus Methylopumilus universalis TaxID=2588536 RepID=UPI003BEF3684